MGKGFNNYMTKKFFHPASKDNIKRVWMAKQKTDYEKKKQEDLMAQYQREQETLSNRALLGDEKAKMGLSFLYDAPPGMRSKEKEDDEPEYKFEWQRKYNAPREAYAKGDDTISDQPFGIEVRNIRCIKCRQWGHVNTDKLCPLFGKNLTAEPPQPETSTSSLLEGLKEEGFQLKQSMLGRFMASTSGEAVLTGGDEEDPEVQFLKSLTPKQKKKLSKKLNKLQRDDSKHGKVKKEKKKKKKKKSQRKTAQDSSDTESNSSDEGQRKESNDKKRSKQRDRKYSPDREDHYRAQGARPKTRTGNDSRRSRKHSSRHGSIIGDSDNSNERLKGRYNDHFQKIHPKQAEKYSASHSKKYGQSSSSDSSSGSKSPASKSQQRATKRKHRLEEEHRSRKRSRSQSVEAVHYRHQSTSNSPSPHKRHRSSSRSPLRRKDKCKDRKRDRSTSRDRHTKKRLHSPVAKRHRESSRSPDRHRQQQY